MNRPIAYGIDFGTTNSLLSVATEDSVDLLTVDGDSELLPSLIYLHRGALRSAGSDATDQYVNTATNRTRCGSCALVKRDQEGGFSDCDHYSAKAGAGCLDSRLISEIKRTLADPGWDKTHSWARNFDSPYLVATIFKTLKRRADRRFGCDVRRVVVGHPVAFEGAEGNGFTQRQGLAKARLRKAAEEAGFTDVEMLEEPAAAILYDQDEGIVLAADFGGGTFDVSIIELTETTGRVRALAGTPVGGEQFDSLLFQHAIFPQLGLLTDGKHHLPNQFRNALGSRAGAVRVLANPGLTEALYHFNLEGDRRGAQRLRTILNSGWIYDLYSAVEQAKCRLSEVATTRIRFDKPGVDINVEVSRQEFNRLISTKLTLVRGAIRDALEQAELTPDQIDVVACTGGSSLLPAFQTLLSDLFVADKIRQREPYSAIALGLGQHARRIWHE